MECGWDRQIRDEHRLLDSQREALRISLERPDGLRDRRIQILKILRSLDLCLRLHLEREERTLFPALERLIGDKSGMLALLKTQHGDLRSLLDRLPRMLEDREGTSWEAIVETGEVLTDLLEDHEEKEGRFLTEILGSSLAPQELNELAKEFHHAASCLCEQEA